ncbi:MAG: membrane protein, partial [Actinomycetota bacterium]|nr:membrane protein [Actinomycetota bacterium]
LFAGQLSGEFAIVLMLIGVLGMLCLILADKPAAMLLGTLFIGYLAHVLFYLERGIEDFAVFIIPAYAVFGLCISIGIGFLQSWMERLPANRPAFRRASAIVFPVLAFAVVLASVPDEYARWDRGQDTEGRRTIEAVVKNTGLNSTVLHHRSPLWYMVLVEERRQDLRLVDPFCTSWTRFDDVAWPDPPGASRYGTPDPTGVETAREAARSGRIYILAREFEQQKASFRNFQRAGFQVVPVGEDGLLYEILPRDETVEDRRAHAS